MESEDEAESEVVKKDKRKKPMTTDEEAAHEKKKKQERNKKLKATPISSTPLLGLSPTEARAARLAQKLYDKQEEEAKWVAQEEADRAQVKDPLSAQRDELDIIQKKESAEEERTRKNLEWYKVLFIDAIDLLTLLI